MLDLLADADTGAATAADVLARAASERSAADAAEARLLEQAAVWADLHPPESIDHAATFGHAVPGSEHEVPIAGAGCPLVAEFCIAELAAALAMSTTAGKRLIGHALELRHRLPRLWTAVHSGKVPTWRARRVAEATIHADLTPAGATFVDQMVTPFAHAVGIAQLDRIIAEALQRYGTHSPSADPEGGDGLHDSRFVQIDPPLDPYGGTALLRGELDLADALDLEGALATGAAGLKDLGSQASLDVRRSMALGDLARHQNSLDYPTQDESPEPDSTGREACSARTSTTGRPARQVVLRVGLTAAVTGEGDIEFDRLATLDQGQLQVLLDQVKSWCNASHTAVTVQPVLDLAARIRSNGYRPAAFLREQVIERDRTCVFPWCSRPARACQIDHITPHDPDDPDAGTHSDNLAWLCTFHHRLKTHGRWRYRMTALGEYQWTSPHGHTYLRDHTGTRQPPRP